MLLDHLTDTFLSAQSGLGGATAALQGSSLFYDAKATLSSPTSFCLPKLFSDMNNFSATAYF